MAILSHISPQGDIDLCDIEAFSCDIFVIYGFIEGRQLFYIDFVFTEVYCEYRAGADPGSDIELIAEIIRSLFA